MPRRFFRKNSQVKTHDKISGLEKMIIKKKFKKSDFLNLNRIFLNLNPIFFI